MSAVTHVLDTSAVLAHYFDEPGAEIVDGLWQDSRNRIAICVLTLPELRWRMQAEIEDEREIDRACQEYAGELTSSLVVDSAVAESAIALRREAERLPLTDAIIAGCAHAVSAVLVHRDRHMESIPQRLVSQIVLPRREAPTPPGEAVQGSL
ncbi:MAG: PIN domain-containing protein [Spirochaetaceae bacterium]|nr:PIN domain-containing protein [Spirochaetaceae bacterium]